MADCPGVLHLAEMADGGLARLRAPGGALSARQARGVASAAETLGSGVVDLTNRANLQIRGLAMTAGDDLVDLLSTAGFRFHGEADRRRNILLDPFSGVDPSEVRDLRALCATLEDALVSAPWIGRLSPKFSFALDGGGASHVDAVASDVVIHASVSGLEVAAAGFSAVTPSEHAALDAAMAVAEAAAGEGIDRRASGLGETVLRSALGRAGPVGRSDPRSLALNPRYGAVTARDGSVALALPAPVGRLDAAMLRFAADMAESDGEGRLVLAPWSAVVIPGLRADRADALLERSVGAGFLPVAVAGAIAVTACSGAPACPRAREPAKALAQALLALAAAEPERLPATRRSLHLSACSKGCAGSSAADLLLLGSSDRAGWSVHADATPRKPGAELGRIDKASAADLLARLASMPSR